MLGVHGMPWDVLQKGIQKMSILIKNGRVIDPDTRKDGRYDILIEEDKIVKVDQEIKEGGRRSDRCRRLLRYAGPD